MYKKKPVFCQLVNSSQAVARPRMGQSKAWVGSIQRPKRRRCDTITLERLMCRTPALRILVDLTQALLRYKPGLLREIPPGCKFTEFPD